MPTGPHSLRPLPVSAVLITLNEEANLPRCLESLRGLVSDIVIIDAGSTDRTADVARAHGARFEVRPWPGYVAQKNAALALASQPWVLGLDADEAISPELAASLRDLFARGEPAADAYWVNRLNFYVGAWIRHVWYPEWRLRLARAGRATWTGGDLHERLETQGSTARLGGHLLHYSYRDLQDHFDRTIRYARLAAGGLARAGSRPRWYHLACSPWLAFLKQLLVKGAWRDGWRGWVIASATFTKVFAKYAFLYEQRWSGRNADTTDL